MEYREYTGTISVNLSDMGKIVDMHTALLNHAETKYGQSRLEQHLAGLGLTVSAVIGYFSKIPGPTGKIALAAAAIAAQTYEILRAIVSSPFTLDKVLKVGLQGSTNSVGLARNLTCRGLRATLQDIELLNLKPHSWSIPILHLRVAKVSGIFKVALPLVVFNYMTALGSALPKMITTKRRAVSTARFSLQYPK